MALFRNSAIVGAISGNIGGQTFVLGRHANIVRNTPHPPHNQSPLQLLRQGQNAHVSAHWRTLTALQQDSWRAAGAALVGTNAVGSRVPLSGFRYFMKTNFLQFMIEGTISDEPQAINADEAIENPVLSVVAGPTMEVAFDNSIGGGGYVARFLIYGNLLYRSTVTKKIGPFQFCGVTVGPYSGPIDVGALFTKVFSFPEAGQFYSIKMVPWDTLRISGPASTLSDLR